MQNKASEKSSAKKPVKKVAKKVTQKVIKKKETKKATKDPKKGSAPKQIQQKDLDALVLEAKTKEDVTPEKYTQYLNDTFSPLLEKLRAAGKLTKGMSQQVKSMLRFMYRSSNYQASILELQV